MAALIVSLGACEDSTAPTVARVSGSYRASVLTLHHPENIEDLLAKGGFLTLDLARDGTTTGELFVPGGEEDGSDLSADLAGTWTLRDGVVTLQHDADTFVRDMVLEPVGDRLLGSTGQGSVTISVVLDRVGDGYAP